MDAARHLFAAVAMIERREVGLLVSIDDQRHDNDDDIAAAARPPSHRLLR